MKIGRVLTVLPMLLVSSVAWAQEVQVQIGGPPPPPPPPPPPRVVVVQPAPGYGYGPPVVRMERPPFPRFRWGLSFEGGPYFFNGSTGGVGGVNVRAGVQINELFGVYAQPIALIGAGASVSNGSSQGSGIIVGGLGVLADLTLGNIFYVAAGPELMAGVAGAGDSSGTASAAEGVFFAVTGRLGLELGVYRPHRRAGFQLGADFHLIFTPGGPVITPMLALGYDMF